MSSLLFFIKKLTVYKRELCSGILLSIVLAASSIALLTLSGWFISAAAFAGLTLTAATAFNYFIPASMIRLLAFIRILSRYFDRIINHDFTFRILSTLRVWFYQKLIPLAPAQILSHRSGDLLNRIVNDIDTLDHLYLNVLSPFIVALFLLLSITFFISYFSILLAMIIFIILCFTLTCIPAITFSKSKKIGKIIQETTANLRTQTIDFLQNFTDLLLFTTKEKRLWLVNEEHVKLMRAQKKFTHLKGFTISAMNVLSGISVFLIFMIGIPLVQKQVIHGAELVMIVLLIIATFDQLLSLPFAFLSLGKTKAAATRLLEIAHTKPAVIFSDKKNIIDHYSVSFNHVSFHYPNRMVPVLNNITLEIKAGTHVGITGDSGSGKTTLAYLVARIWDPTVGDITVGGIHLKDFSGLALRKTISLVTQHVHIFNASVRDNLTLMQKEISDEQCYDVLKKVKLENHIKNLPEKLNTLMGEFGKNFSGGQIRRISIARALLANTPILILDEPSTGLEDVLMHKIWEDCMLDFKNKTIIVIAHDEKLLSYMNRIIHMETHG